jgi:glycine hydroxymethyltransferase
MSSQRTYKDQFLEASLAETDPFLSDLVSWEENRQQRKLILIPSESICPRSVREALASPFTNLYAEGYPPRFMDGATEAEIRDVELPLIHYRRYADRRFYKGTEYVHFVESLAKTRVARCFATPQCPAEFIYANVQPLSGAAANNAVYEAFLAPGDLLMGMALPHGGHLTHGSEHNRSGKHHRVISYGVRTDTERLDYEDIRRLTVEHRPRLIVAGFTSYPWAPDWVRLRQIADEVGAILLADIAHPAGLVVAGLYPNPVGIADVVTFTTHKTLCGPRGAVILTTDPAKAQRIDSAVFPGEQGGPHVNKMAAMAVAFHIAQTRAFGDLQKRIVDNAQALSRALVARGVKICYGGTDTHLLVVDLRGMGKETGYPLMGEIAARILDLAGLVVNKNTIPGDHSFADARGIRLGTPWATQRGMGPGEMETVAEIIQRLLSEIRPFTYEGATALLPRGKVPLEVLEEARGRVQALLRGRDLVAGDWGYPHEANGPESRMPDSAVHEGTDRPGSVPSDEGSVALEDSSAGDVLEVRGDRAWAFLQEVCTRDLTGLSLGESRETFLLDGNGALLDRVSVQRAADDAFLVRTHPERTREVCLWFRRLSEGYVLFDPEDILIKIQGPVRVWSRPGSNSPTQAHAGPEKPGALALWRAHPELFDLNKPYFAGLWALREAWPKPPVAAFNAPSPPSGTRRTCLHPLHVGRAKKMAPFAGWEMPIWYRSIQEEHQAVRTRAGLFDVTHMGAIGVDGPDAAHFLDLVTTNYVRWLKPGESQYGYLLGPDGSVIDDLMVYRTGSQEYLVVVNAVNAETDLAWVRDVARGKVSLDRARPGVRFCGDVRIRDLKDPSSGEASLVDVALQGPMSRQVLGRLVQGTQDAWRLRSLRKTEVAHLDLAGIPVWASRTGYTGEPVGFELFVHPDRAPVLWERILDAGGELGVKPVGLGARDSLRIEAGLPLHGAELEGPYGIDPLEAGFGSYVKLHKPFFVGREAMLERSLRVRRKIVRFRLLQKGARMLHSGTLVVHRRTQQLMGWVTSAAPDGEGVQVGLALVEARLARAGTPIALLSVGPGQRETGGEFKPGDRLPLHEEGVVLTRFPGRD